MKHKKRAHKVSVRGYQRQQTVQSFGAHRLRANSVFIPSIDPLTAPSPPSKH